MATTKSIMPAKSKEEIRAEREKNRADNIEKKFIARNLYNRGGLEFYEGSAGTKNEETGIIEITVSHRKLFGFGSSVGVRLYGGDRIEFGIRKPLGKEEYLHLQSSRIVDIPQKLINDMEENTRKYGIVTNAITYKTLDKMLRALSKDIMLHQDCYRLLRPEELRVSQREIEFKAE